MPISNPSGAAGSWTKIGSQVLTGAAASIDFSSIAAGYRKFRVTISVVTAVAGTFAFRANNDSGGNYYSCTVHNTGAVVSGTNQSGATSGKITTTATDKTCSIVLHIANDNAVQPHGYSTDCSGPFTSEDITSGYWNSSAEISRLTFIEQGGNNLSAGTTILLEGWNGQ